MKTFIFTTILLTANLASAILVIPNHCRFSRQDTAAPPRSSNPLSALMQTTRDAAGRSAMKFLEKGYARRTDLERRMIERNPSYALPYANSNLFAPLLAGMMCNIDWNDFDVAGGLNHFLISAILTAQIGRDDGCKLVMSHEKGDDYVSNSYMDIHNNLLGNEAGVTHRAEIIACMNLMVNFATQKIQQEKKSSIFDTIEQIDVFGYSSTLGPYTDLSPQTIARRFSIKNPQTNNVKDPEACNNLKKIIKDVYMPRLYYKETSSCDSAMGGTPNTTNWELDRKPFDEYRTNMDSAIVQ